MQTRGRGGIFFKRGFNGLWVWRPPNPEYLGLIMIMSVRQAANSYCRPTVSGNFSEVDSWVCEPWTVSYTAAGGEMDHWNKLKQHELYKHMIYCAHYTKTNCPFSLCPTVQQSLFQNESSSSTTSTLGLCWLTNCQLYNLHKPKPTCTMGEVKFGLSQKAKTKGLD